jgi:hypothetical protein
MRRAVLAAVVLVALSGCLGLLGGEETPEADEVSGSSVNATESLSSYGFDAEMTVDVTLAENGSLSPEDGEPPSITMFYDGEGSVDVEGRAMRVESTRTTRLGTGTRETEASVYLGNGSAYIDSGDGWRRLNSTGFGDVWRAHDVVRTTAEALGAEVSLADEPTETVRGEEAYVLEAGSHGERYARALLERVRLYSQTEPEGGMRVTDAEVEESAVTVWVDADERYPLRSESETVFDATLETGAGEAEARLSVESETSVSDHNGATVEPPETGGGFGPLPPVPR